MTGEATIYVATVLAGSALIASLFGLVVIAVRVTGAVIAGIFRTIAP